MTADNQPDNQATFTLALQQHTPTPAELDTSIERVRAAAKNASAQGAQLLLVPEASITGYNIPKVVAQEMAVEAEGYVTDTLKSIGKDASIALAYGYIERDGDSLFNSVQVVDASGNSIAHYRKTHLWGDLDRNLFTTGDAYAPVFELDGWKIGLLICYDIEFPESVRHLALSGCELVLVPTALMTPWTFVADHVTRVRAVENQLYVAYANYCGNEGDIHYVGHSCIVAPDGAELAKAGSEPTLLIATLAKDTISKVRHDVPYHTDRRPELYGALT